MYTYNLGLRFNKIVEDYPENVALMFSAHKKAKYGELNMVANKIAGYLLENNVEQKDIVCLAGDKNLITFSAIIACLKIGATYCVLDADSPVERIEKILNTCRPKMLFANRQLLAKLSETVDRFHIKTETNEASYLIKTIQRFDTANPAETKKINGNVPAYIMFTSGSTGVPKGAVLTHAGVLNLIEWSIKEFKITPDDVHTNVNHLYFDNSVFDFYSSLFTGASLVPFSKEQVTDARSLVNLIDKFQCTQWFSVPTLLIYLQTMRVLDEGNLKYLKRIIFGGEGYPKAKLKNLFNLYGGRINLINVYGPTECTCICSSYKISESDFEDMQGFPPLGELIENFSYNILDKNNKKVADNKFGELCLLGPNIGKGYFNDPERTEQNFIQNPLNHDYVETLYKTGDMVKYNPQDKKLYIGGRIDNQIKHMGYRIELEEVESALSRLDFISQVAVVHGANKGLSKMIAAYCSKSPVEEKTIRAGLKQIIPDYMIPNAFYPLDELPKNANGKVDRRRIEEIFL
jgi:amino acid adenylation domain-containing protein